MRLCATASGRRCCAAGCARCVRRLIVAFLIFACLGLLQAWALDRQASDNGQAGAVNLLPRPQGPMSLRRAKIQFKPRRGATLNAGGLAWASRGQAQTKDSWPCAGESCRRRGLTWRARPMRGGAPARFRSCMSPLLGGRCEQLGRRPQVPRTLYAHARSKTQVLRRPDDGLDRSALPVLSPPAVAAGTPLYRDGDGGSGLAW